MDALIISLSITAVLTAMFSFRFGYRDRPGVLVGFALLVFIVESIGQHFFLPPGAIGVEVAWICFPLALVFVGVTFLMRRLEGADTPPP